MFTASEYISCLEQMVECAKRLIFRCKLEGQAPSINCLVWSQQRRRILRLALARNRSDRVSCRVQMNGGCCSFVMPDRTVQVSQTVWNINVK